MSHTYARNYIHVIFATKNRCAALRGEHAEIAHNAMRRTAVEYGVAIDTLGGVENHVHLLIQLPPKLAAASLVRAIKANSSKALNDRGSRFSWQEGYGCFSVSMSQLHTVRRYIESQAEHHRKMTFGDEYDALLDKHGFERVDA